MNDIDFHSHYYPDRITASEIKCYAFCVFQTTEETNRLRFRKTLYIDDLCVDQKYRRNHIG